MVAENLDLISIIWAPAGLTIALLNWYIFQGPNGRGVIEKLSMSRISSAAQAGVLTRENIGNFEQFECTKKEAALANFTLWTALGLLGAVLMLFFGLLRLMMIHDNKQIAKELEL